MTVNLTLAQVSMVPGVSLLKVSKALLVTHWRDNTLYTKLVCTRVHQGGVDMQIRFNFDILYLYLYNLLNQQCFYEGTTTIWKTN